MTDSIAPVRSELAPTGTLPVALNMRNFLLTATDPVTGEPCGIAVDLGRELGQCLDIPVALLPYPNPEALADAAATGVWDIGFLGAEPQRAHAIDFTAVQQAAGTPKGRPMGAAYLRACIEDLKVTGLVTRTTAKHNVRGLTVAPPA
jgi:hypothetical protein